VTCVSGASPRPRSNSRRSSYSGTSTGSDAPSSNGPCDGPRVFNDSDDGADQPRVMSRAVKDRRPSPPPRRFIPGSGDVWQRRPATDVLHRRVLATEAANGPSSAPNSCPSSPLLDGIGLRRPQDDAVASHPQIVGGGHSTHPPPASQNHHGAVTTGSTSVAVTQRTRLPLSPLVRTQRGVR